MGVNETEPKGSKHLVMDLDNYQRETRERVNYLLSLAESQGWSAVGQICSVEMETGETELVVDEHVGDLLIEIVQLTGQSAINLQHITGARAGQIKIFILGDGNITFIDYVTKMKLNGGVNFAATAGDIICLANIDGDPEVPANGYWKELFRTEWT